jgi:ribosome-binding protein aMBF1 (putative translation factor)
VYSFGDYLPTDAIPNRHLAVDDLIAAWERDPVRRVAMEHARRWVADEFHAEEGVTLRTLRLRKGLSQQQLANALGTSQSHVARIEGGANGLNIDTCRRLARTLEVDLNSLDQALQNQERVALSKNAE